MPTVTELTGAVVVGATVAELATLRVWAALAVAPATVHSNIERAILRRCMVKPPLRSLLGRRACQNERALGKHVSLPGNAGEKRVPTLDGPIATRGVECFSSANEMHRNIESEGQPVSKG